MIAVSNGWIAAHKQTLLPETFIEITYAATDPSLAEAATVTANSEAYYSNVSNLVSDLDKRGTKLATLERGLWGLDGSYVYLDGTPTDPGYVSAVISDASGAFADTIPTITINFSLIQVEAIPGLTITWSTTYGEWATSFRVTAYNAGTQVAQTTVADNTSTTSILWLAMENFTQITIEILGWSHPNHRARCSKIFPGVTTIYHKEDLMGFEHSQSVDLLSAALPKNEITFRLRNDDDRWNPDNPVGIERFLLERQELRVRYGMTVDGETEWIKGGTFWLSEWSTPANGLEASFTARDLIEFMHETYTGTRSGTLYEVALAAFTQAGLPLQDNGDEHYVIDTVLQGYTTDFTEDTTSYTIAEILQMVAHAGNCVFYSDRDGVVRIEAWNTGYSGYMIDQSISYAHPEYSFNKPLKSISVAYGEDLRAVVTVADRGEVQTVDNPLLVTREDALRVGEKAREVLESRKTLSGEFRADLRLDALDPIIVTSKYASNIIAITDIQYSTTGGAFKGSYTGRVVSLALQTEKLYSGEIYAGEIG